MNIEQRNQLMAESDILALDGNTDHAVNILQEILRAYPADIRAASRLAKIYKGLGKSDDAKKWYSSVLELAPWHVGARAALTELDSEEAKAAALPVTPTVRAFLAGSFIVVALVAVLFAIVSGLSEGDSGETQFKCGEAVAGDAASAGTDSSSNTSTFQVDGNSSGIIVFRGAAPKPTEAVVAPPPAGEAPADATNAPCTKDTATSVTVTNKDEAGALEVGTSYLSIAATLFGAALLMILLPWIKKATLGPVNFEAGPPEGPSKQKPVA